MPNSAIKQLFVILRKQRYVILRKQLFVILEKQLFVILVYNQCADVTL